MLPMSAPTVSAQGCCSRAVLDAVEGEYLAFRNKAMVCMWKHPAMTAIRLETNQASRHRWSRQGRSEMGPQDDFPRSLQRLSLLGQGVLYSRRGDADDSVLDSRRLWLLQFKFQQIFFQGSRWFINPLRWCFRFHFPLLLLCGSRPAVVNQQQREVSSTQRGAESREPQSVTSSSSSTEGSSSRKRGSDRWCSLASQLPATCCLPSGSE